MNDTAIGYVGVVVAVLFFGSNFVLLKNIIINDGIFFQFCMCNAIFMTSIPIMIIQDYPPIHGFALLGGFLWCTGNLLCPIAIRFIGVGLGLILWGCSSMVLGWATGKFGLFGLTKQHIGDPVLNYVGMCLAILGLLVFVQVKTKDTSLDSRSYRIMKNYLQHNNKSRRTVANILIPSNNTNNNNHSKPFHGSNNHADNNQTNKNRKDVNHVDNKSCSISQPMLSNYTTTALDKGVLTSVDVDAQHPYPHHHYPRQATDEDDEDGDGDEEGEIYVGRFESSVYEDSTTTDTIADDKNNNRHRSLNKRSNNNNNNNNNSVINKPTVTFGDDWSEDTKRIVGVTCALAAGIFFGTSFDPSQYIIDHDYGGDDDTLNYVFSQYLGILLTSWSYTIIYCVYCYYQNVNPYITSEIFLPATASGIIWGIAETSYFLANGKLGFPITFPIISSGPGFIGSLWGVCVYNEINGTDNLRMLTLAFCITIPALVLVGVSH